MGLRRTVVRNVFANQTGTAVTVLTGIFLMPFVVSHLGNANYAVWILLGYFTGYFGVLDVGVRDAVSRYLAFYRARDDAEMKNVVLNTAMAILSVVGFVAFLGALSLQLFFFNLFEVPASEVLHVRLALLVSGTAMAAAFPTAVFTGTLWSAQRFDLINVVQSAVVLVRAALIYLFISRGYGILALSCITLATELSGAAARAWFSFRIDPQLRIRMCYARHNAVRMLLGFGFWSFWKDQGRRLSFLVSPTIIGHFLLVSMVTPYSIAMRLIAYAGEIMVNTTGVITPIATAFHAKDEHERQKRLCLEGGKYALALANYFLLGFIFLGQPFINAWMGPGYEKVGLLLILLSSTKLFSMAQGLLGNVVLAQAKHKALAYIAIFHTFVLAHIALRLVGRGVVGVCIASAAASLLTQAIPTMIYGCRLVGLRLQTYLARSIAPSLLAAAPPAAFFYLLVKWRAPSGWVDIFLYGGAYTVVYALSCAPVIGLQEIKRFWARPAGIRAAIGDAAPNQEAPVGAEPTEGRS